MQQTKECVYVNVLFVNTTIYFDKRYLTQKTNQIHPEHVPPEQ